MSRLLISLLAAYAAAALALDAPPDRAASRQDAAPAASIGAPPGTGSDDFLFQVKGQLDSLSSLAQATGGSPFASWNPTGNPQFFAPGMKISFFGDPVGCASGTKLGTVRPAAPDALRDIVARTGVAAGRAELSWVPAGDASGCSGVAERSGPSMVYLSPGRGTGGLVMYTASGPRSDGRPEFFHTFGPAGQNGSGANANIVGTYVTFRQPWKPLAKVRPWARASGAERSARVLVEMGVAGSQVGSAAGPVAQTQQLISLHVINSRCQASGITKERPCQIEYLFNAVMHRNNVTDWSSVPWAQTVRVWYDVAQGGMPIVEGQLKPDGNTSVERESGLGIYTSRGQATRHAPFADGTFDIRIELKQLFNTLRILTARPKGIAPANVSDAELASMWGDAWSQPDAWVVESVTVAQEISNPDSQRAAWIAGRVREVYVGPAP